ncbi:hypothetical protein IFE17_10685 [Actinobacillus sp. GY-402]|nr:hypothetical protein IFE17_10685 [Actinobacillus sp. GY-402]
MKINRSFYIYVAACLLSFSTSTFSASSELAPRQGMSPLDKAKVHSVQAQNWAKMGKAGYDAEEVTERSTEGSSVSGIGSRSCTTNIGTTTTKSGVSSGKYGPSKNSDNIVIIKGDVVSLCK